MDHAGREPSRPASKHLAVGEGAETDSFRERDAASRSSSAISISGAVASRVCDRAAGAPEADADQRNVQRERARERCCESSLHGLADYAARCTRVQPLWNLTKSPRRISLLPTR